MLAACLLIASYCLFLAWRAWRLYTQAPGTASTLAAAKRADFPPLLERFIGRPPLLASREPRYRSREDGARGSIIHLRGGGGIDSPTADTPE